MAFLYLHTDLHGHHYRRTEDGAVVAFCDKGKGDPWATATEFPPENAKHFPPIVPPDPVSELEVLKAKVAALESDVLALKLK